MGNSSPIIKNSSSLIIVRRMRYPYLRINQRINVDSPEEYLKLFKNINLMSCKDYRIGPYYNEKSINIFVEKYNDNNVKILKELLNLSNFHDFFVNNEVDYEKFINSKNMLKLISVSNIDEAVFFCPSMAFRPILYSIKLSQTPENFSYQSEALPCLSQKIIDELSHQIDADLQRTKISSNLIMYYDIFLENLGRILFEAGLRDKEISYVQGFNFIVAFLLMITGNDMELSFVIFVKMLYIKSEYFGCRLRDAFSQNFLLSENYKVLLKELLSRHDSKLFSHLMSLDSGFFWTDKWIHTLFVLNFSFEATVKFWDFIIARGADIIVKIIFSVIIFLRPKIMKCKELEEFIAIVEGIRKLDKEEEEKMFASVVENLVENKIKI